MRAGRTIISPARLWPAAMAGPDLLPRIVTRGNTALSWSGIVPWPQVVEGMDRALQEFGKVLVWDMEGIERNRPDLEIVRHFEGEELWVDAGVRRLEGLIDLIVAGAERAVVGTKTLQAVEEVEDAIELTDNIVPQLDFAYGELRTAGRVRGAAPGDLLRRFRDLGLGTALLLDEESKVPESVLKEAPQGMALYAGIVPKGDAESLPPGAGAIVDFWEVVPRKT